MEAPIPILRSVSETEAKAFYIDYLGFTLGFQHRFDAEAPLYFEASRGECRLHISEHHGDATPGQTLRIGIPDAEAFLAEITARGHTRQRPQIADVPWGFREVTVTDPFSNRLIFCHPL